MENREKKYVVAYQYPGGKITSKVMWDRDQAVLFFASHMHEFVDGELVELTFVQWHLKNAEEETYELISLCGLEEKFDPPSREVLGKIKSSPHPFRWEDEN